MVNEPSVFELSRFHYVKVRIKCNHGRTEHEKIRERVMHSIEKLALILWNVLKQDDCQL